jgi:hypothetical protein
MKKLLFRSGLVVFCMTAFLGLNAFTTTSSQQYVHTASKSIGVSLVAGQYKEFVLKVNELNEKNMTEVRNAIELQGGIVFKGYCQSMNVLMYLVNTTMHPDNSFLNKLTVLNYTYEIKEGSTIRQICDACGMEPVANPDPASQTE